MKATKKAGENYLHSDFFFLAEIKLFAFALFDETEIKYKNSSNKRLKKQTF